MIRDGMGMNVRQFVTQELIIEEIFEYVRRKGKFLGVRNKYGYENQSEG